jgi:hypothetical protein
MGKMSDTSRGVETSTKTGETDQGVTRPILPPRWVWCASSITIRAGRGIEEVQLIFSVK